MSPVPSAPLFSDLSCHHLSCHPHPQVIGEAMGSAYLKMKLKDQQASLEMIENDPSLAGLRRIQAPLVDLEVIHRIEGK